MQIRARPERGLDYVTVHVICAHPNINKSVEFVVDTGSSKTTISYGGALGLGLTPKSLLRGQDSIGVGGSTPTYRTGRAYISFVKNTVRSFPLKSMDLMWPRPHSSKKTKKDMENVPNLLGSDILEHCKISYRRRKHRRLMTIEVL